MIRVRFDATQPERLLNVVYKPFGDFNLNGESMPYEFSGQSIRGMWAGQGFIWPAPVTQLWQVLEQDQQHLRVRIESQSVKEGTSLLEPPVSTVYTFFADSAGFQVERTFHFDDVPLTEDFQLYVLRVSLSYAAHLRWRSDTGSMQQTDPCLYGCWTSAWDRHWVQTYGGTLGVALMLAPECAGTLRLAYDRDNNSWAEWASPITGSIACSSDKTYRMLVHFSTSPSDVLLLDGVYAWFAALPPAAVDAAPPVAALGLELAPNPSAAAVRVALALSAPAAVDVAVFDLAGRRVATLRSGACAAGTTTLAWDGRDARGARVPPGLYLVRAARDGAAVARRLVRLE